MRLQYHTFRILFATNGAASDGAPVVTSLDVRAVDRGAAEADVLAGFFDVRVISIMQVS